MTSEELIRLSFENKELIKPDELCGCYYCLSVFKGSNVHEFAVETSLKETAICPECNTDSVLPGVTAYITLLELQKRYF